jgi:tetratricopeptide (TPR) repeat protein
VLSMRRRGGPARHQTLQATLDWSYQLLEPEEQSVLRRLVVFAGGWEMVSAEAVAAGAGVEPAQVARIVASLVDKSLVHTDAAGWAGLRYRLLEMVRQYVLERLSDEELAAARLAHARWYRDLAKTAAPQLVGLAQEQWIRRLDVEDDNLRSAMAYFLDQSTLEEEAAQFCLSLEQYWYTRARHGEGAAAFSRALARPRNSLTAPTRAAALSGLGKLLINDDVGHFDEVRACFEESLALASDVGDDRLVYLAISGLAEVVQLVDGDDDLAMSMATRGVEAADRHGQANDIGRARMRRAMIASRAVGRGVDMSQLGPHADVDADLRDALDWFLEAGNRWMAAMDLSNWAAYNLTKEDLPAARSHLEAALGLVASMEQYHILPHILDGLGEEARLRRDYGAARRYLLDAIRLSYNQLDRVTVILVLADLSISYTDMGDHWTASILRGVFDAQKTLSAGMQQNGSAFAAAEAECRRVLGDSQYQNAYGQGRVMTLAAMMDMIAANDDAGP